MPLTAKGERVMGAMKKEYGSKKGEQVFYASRNSGTVSGVDSDECHKYMDAVRRGDSDEMAASSARMTARRS